jgi:hypothetical protein
MAGEIRDGHIRRVRGEPMPTQEEADDEDDQVFEKDKDQDESTLP